MKNFAMVKMRISETIPAILQKYDLKIYEINNVQDFNGDVLQILVEGLSHPNKLLDFDLLIKVNEEISEFLDNGSDLKESYLLEIASAGLEKAIRNVNELISAVGSYVRIQFTKTIDKQQTVSGILKNYDDVPQMFELDFFIKGRLKKIQFHWDDIAYANYAVKF